jgi:carboxyl-terminal processing protease
MMMSSLFRRPRWLLPLFALALAVPATRNLGAPIGTPETPAALIGQDRKFSTPETLARETTILVQLLTADHYNRDAVHSSDYANIIPDYMTKLDGQHLFFLASDQTALAARYGKDVFYNLRFAGNIDPAYEIFYVYQHRVEQRVSWVFAALKGNFDFTGNDEYAYDRTKLDWPANADAADDLWQRALKSELLTEMINKKTLDEAKKIVRERYERMLKNIGEIDGSDLAERYLDCVAELYDPHSTYFSADTFEDFNIQMRLKLVGIGAVLESKDDYCVVKELVPGGPADLDHRIKPSDRIIAVAQDGQPAVEIIGMKLIKIVSMIRGAKDTRVHLTVEPANATDASKRKEIIITRDVVKLESARASAALFQVPGADGKNVPLGVITLRAFYGQGDDPSGENITATQDIANLIGKLKQAKVQGIVLDLRNNGGGYLSEAVDISGLFLHPGPVVQVRDSEGSLQVDNDSAPKVAYDGPLAVLVNRFSASASEIVTGALQDYGRAVVIGDSSTHGKGTVQTVLEMKNLDELLAHSAAKTGAAKITIQKFYLPNGASTQLKGVLSDIVLPSADEYLPIGESDLPHALVWDQIPGVHFEGEPLSPKLLTQLRQDSLDRQAHLAEFAYLRKDVDWIKSRLDEKELSLNLDDRKQEQQQQDAFKKEMDATRDRLQKADYAFQEFRLGPPRPPKATAPKSAVAAAAAPAVTPNPPSPDDAKPQLDSTKADLAKTSAAPADDDDDEMSTDDDSYDKLDVSLRESLRILDDAINLGANHDNWASNHAPLTVAADKS